MQKKQELTPQKIKEKRKYERYELFLPVHMKIFKGKNPVIRKRIEGFSRNYSVQGLLLDVTTEEIKGAEEISGLNIEGEVFLPGEIQGFPFEGEIRWAREVENKRFFLGILITRINDIHNIKLLKFAQKVNRKSKVIVTLVITLFIVFTISLMLIFSFNAYIKKLTSRQNFVFKELNERIDFLTSKIKKIVTM